MAILALVSSLAAAGCATSPVVDDMTLRAAANPDAIATRMNSQRHLLDACRNVYGSGRLDGTLVLRFKVRADGTTQEPHIFESIGQSAALDRCLTDAALQLRFDPMPTGVVAQVEYPLEFKRASARTPATNRKSR